MVYAADVIYYCFVVDTYLTILANIIITVYVTTVLSGKGNIMAPRYLLLRNTLATVSLLGTADALQQRINGDWDPKNNKPWDFKRTCKCDTVFSGTKNGFTVRL